MLEEGFSRRRAATFCDVPEDAHAQCNIPANVSVKGSRDRAITDVPGDLQFFGMHQYGLATDGIPGRF